MFFFPIGCLLLILFILFLPILFLLGFLGIATFSFARLGIPPGMTLLILFLTLVGSMINIPIKKREVEYIVPFNSRHFGWFEVPRTRGSGLAINLGGAIIPVCLSFYFLTKIPSLWPVLAATLVITVISKFLARPVPGIGIALPMFIPPLLAALLAIFLARDFAAPCAYISGVLGTIIGADLLNLKKAEKLGVGMVSIGGAGVFDGIFLVGIASVFLTAFFG